MLWFKALSLCQSAEWDNFWCSVVNDNNEHQLVMFWFYSRHLETATDQQSLEELKKQAADVFGKSLWLVVEERESLQVYLTGKLVTVKGSAAGRTDPSLSLLGIP